MNLDQIIRLARVRATFDFSENYSSSWFCFVECIKNRDGGDLDSARHWAVRSLKHSVGIFHQDYQQASGGKS